MNDVAGSKLQELVTQARDLDGIDAVLVMDRDGMTLSASAAEGVDTESLSATAANSLLVADALGAELGHLGEATQTTIEYAGGVVILMPLDEDLALLILAHTGANLGRLRLLARRSRGDLLTAAQQYVMLPGSAVSAGGREHCRLGIRPLADGTYAGAGVDIDAKARVLASLRERIRATHGPQVLGDFGHFGGLYALPGAGIPYLSPQ